MKGYKMQTVNFKSVDEFLEFLPEVELIIVKALRSMVLDTIPDVSEKLSYNVPYFKRYKNICFIWPSSILWGKNKTYEGVRFGFTSGHLLNDESDYLSKENRKSVYWKDFHSLQNIDFDLLRSFLIEAVEIDRDLHHKKGK